MDRRTLTALTVVVGALMVILLMVGRGGFSSDARALVQAESRKLSTDRKQFDVERQAVLDALAAEPDMFRPGAFDKTWPGRLDEAASRLDAADTAMEQARVILAENDEKKRVDLEQTLERVRSARTFSAAEITEIARLARQRLNLKRQFSDSVAKMETDYKAALAVDLQRVRALVTQAVTTWPEKKADLEQRLEAAAALISNSETAWAQAQAAGAKPQAAGAAIDYDALITAANTLSDNHRNLNFSTITIKDLVSQLNVSWDKIIADMEVREGSVVTFYHQIRKVTTPYVAVDPGVAEAEEKAKKVADESAVGSGNAGTRVEETWVKVDKSRYLSMEKNLGMTIEHKPAGKYDSEAAKTVQAAGYAYMASPEEGRNRYGYWRHSGGSSFWVFYGQYAFMRSMFWGPSYYPIGYGHYRGYRGAYTSGRTWYGRNSSRGGGAIYGSQGARTKTTYANSKYRRSNGYKSTQFVKSGGTYRGSKYAPKSSSRSSYSSSRYSSSRYSSGRSSRRSAGRSRSRSFSGK